MEGLEKRLKKLTSNNNHNESLLEITKHFKFFGHQEIIECIKKIHEIEGHMPRDLYNYRYQLMNEILELIEKNNNKETRERIVSCL